MVDPSFAYSFVVIRSCMCSPKVNRNKEGCYFRLEYKLEYCFGEMNRTSLEKAIALKN